MGKGQKYYKIMIFLPHVHCLPHSGFGDFLFILSSLSNIVFVKFCNLYDISKKQSNILNIVLSKILKRNNYIRYIFTLR